MRSKGGRQRWRRTVELAQRVAPDDVWRADLADALRDASGAAFVTVHTCHPGDLARVRHDSSPGTFDPFMRTLRHRYLDRIEACGEGWRYALQRFGRVYAPLEAARDAELAAEMRAYLAEADVDGYAVATLAADRRDPRSMCGIIVLGGAEPAATLLERTGDELRAVALAASRTLNGALALVRGVGLAAPSPSALTPLTPRERDVARLLADGYSNLNAAARLGVSPQTVGVHARNLYRKLRVHSRVELANLLRAQA